MSLALATTVRKPPCLAFFHSALAALSFSLVVACGGQVVETSPDASSPDRPSTPVGDAAGVDTSVGPPPSPLSPTYDGGGMPLTCPPSPGTPITSTTPFPACTFVDSTACNSATDCGCGCTCECGVCNCNAAGLVSTCTPGSAIAPCCVSANDCGPPCYGLACVGSVCVPAATGASPWTGTWKGSFNWPTMVYDGTCDGGLAPSMATGASGGRFEVLVVGQGDQLAFLLESQEGSGASLCALPFVAMGNAATLVPGSTCVAPGLPNFCESTGPSVSLQTFLSGSAQLDGDTLTMQMADVFVEPEAQGPECGPVPTGNQVNVESMTATLYRSADGG